MVVQVNGLTIERSDLDGFRRIELIGELDLANVPAVLNQLGGSSDGERVIVDTTRLEFIDSIGLAALVEARRRLGQNLELIPGKTTERLLGLTGLGEYFGLG